MELEFVAPQTTGEMLAWIVSLITMLVGVALMIIPRRFGRFLGLVEMNRAGVSEIRGAFGGSWAGFALAALILAQPLIYLAMGLGFIFMVVGRLISFFADKSLNGQTVAATIVEAAAAFFLIAYPLQIIP